MKILCIGDIVGKPGRQAVEGLLNDLRKENGIDFVVANGENIAGGAGITTKLADELLSYGCDVITTGDHVWDQKEIGGYLLDDNPIIRAANFPEGAPGKGWYISETEAGIKVGVINVLGRVFIRYNTDCPFKRLETVVAQIKKETNIIIVDFHAEATSEKAALAHFMDGKVSAVVGTHTHVQTSDERVLPGGTAFITDLGMTGPHDSVIGTDKETIVQRFLTSIPVRFCVAGGDVQLNGAIVEIDESTGKSISIERVRKSFCS